ncbi:MAG: RHS repeat-associated core domain-containing protein, partial [Planctomycetota bacterium]|nr:RHS repeat-associated core domain-containing protein [Planctomycetota bacterium]
SASGQNGDVSASRAKEKCVAAQKWTVGVFVDNDDRLLSEEVQHQPPSLTTPDEQTVWTLDGVGNRKTEIVTRENGTVTTSNKIYSYSARDQLELMSDAVNQLTVAYGYDDNGNRTLRTVTRQNPPSSETVTYIFDARDRMIKAQPNAPNALTVEYVYDADARQVERIETPAPVGATPVAKLFVYSSQTLQHEADPSNELGGLSITDTYRHSAQLDRHIAIAQGGAMTLRSYQLDALNTPVAMTDSNGDTVNRTAYDAWGAITEQVANGVVQAPWQLPNYNPDETGQAALLMGDGQTLGFTGTYQKDAATGLYYANARWYDPLVGGFNAMDPAFGNVQSPISFNKYVYAAANPTYYVDPDGREVWNAQLSRINELAYTSSPARESQLREEIRVEGIRENARLGATSGYFRDTAVGMAVMAADAGKFAAENTGIGMVFGLDMGGRQAVEERGRKLGQAALHPIDTFITPIQQMNARAAQLEAEGDIFGAAYAGHQAQLGAQDVILMGAGALTALRKMALMRGGARLPGPEIGAGDIDLDLDTLIGSREGVRGPSTAPVVANVSDQAALGTVAVESMESLEAATIPGSSSPSKATSVRKRDYPTRVRKPTQQRLEETATDGSGQIRCQNPGCQVEGGKALQAGEGSPQHNPQLVDTHNDAGWNVDQATRNNLYNDTATEIHCIECQRIEGGQTRSTYRFDLGPNYEARPKRKKDGSDG